MSRPATLLVREVDFLMIYSHPIASDLPRGSKTASDQAKRLCVPPWSSATRGIGHWRATCPETGPRGSEEGRAEKEFPRRKPPRRAAYPVHRDLGSGPIINPFPLDRARRGRRAHAHRNPMVRPAMSGPASTGPRCPAASRAARPGRRVQRDLRAVGLREPKRHLVGRLSPGEGTRSRLHLSLSATDVLCGIVKHRDNIFQSS